MMCMLFRFVVRRRELHIMALSDAVWKVWPPSSIFRSANTTIANVYALTTCSHIHKKIYTRDELFALQPRLADAQHQGKVQVKDDYAIVSIVKGMTFILIELESEEALGMVSLAGRTLEVDGLDKEWNKTFIGSYFFVRMGRGKDGATRLRTRMIEGPLEDPATGSAASDLAAYLSVMEGGADKILRYEIVQGVEMGRRSEIFIEVEMKEDRSVSKLYLEGGAVAVMEGRLTI
jgi:PhzF family phenazine biosynthesis protein